MINENTKTVLDILSICTAIGTFVVSILPPLAALASLIWTCLRLWEMWTGRPLADRRKEKRVKKNETSK